MDPVVKPRDDGVGVLREIIRERYIETEKMPTLDVAPPFLLRDQDQILNPLWTQPWQSTELPVPIAQLATETVIPDQVDFFPSDPIDLTATPNNRIFHTPGLTGSNPPQRPDPRIELLQQPIVNFPLLQQPALLENMIDPDGIDGDKIAVVIGKSAFSAKDETEPQEDENPQQDLDVLRPEHIHQKQESLRESREKAPEKLAQNSTTAAMNAEVIQQVMQDFRQQLNRRSTNLRIPIHHDRFGDVEVRLTIKNGSVSASFMAESDEMIQLLAQHRHELEDIFQESDLQTDATSLTFYKKEGLF
ncbi:MAG: flagellar hook-length control protein FliK, partial [Alphaproteobacteria bacterium]|nr:flagellar hook-length control protein FliK [Alphaproteobacteria bacterium]